MKKGFSLTLWVDQTDGHEYHEGDAFPHDGRAIPEDRIEELSTDGNQIGRPVISVKEVEEPKKKQK